MRTAPAARAAARAAGRDRAAGLSVAAALAGAALLASCGGEAPSILAVEWRLESRPAAEGRYESLSVFVAARDGDGMEDLEALWILHDGEELAWTLGSAEWTRRSEGGEEWIGAADLAMPDRSPLPRGPWRVGIGDLAGRRYWKDFRVEDEPGGKPGRAAPSVELSGKDIVLASDWPETLLLFHDSAGALLRAQGRSAGRHERAALLGAQDAPRAASVTAYGYDPATRRGAFSWPKTLR